MGGILKRFDGTLALDGVDFELRRGEIHALLGENGAGKSTLMHVLSGLYSPDGGAIEVEGRPARFRSTADAAQAGIGMVHQHFRLVENLTVAENLALALPERTPFLLPRRGLAAGALEIAERLGWRLDPRAPVWQLPVGMQQRLEIVKVLAQDPQVLIFDEPTAVLAPVELEELFAVLERLRSEGRSLVFISHKLNEVMRLCDRITILRRGRNVGTVSADETDAADLARRMVGDDLAAAERLEAAGTRAPTTGPVVLHVEDLRVRDDRRLEAVRGISLEVRSGEILGLAGVDGNGQAELAEAIVGLRGIAGGGVRYAQDEALVPGPPPRRDLGYIPQDRRRSGVVPGMSVRENLVLELHQEADVSGPVRRRWGFLDWKTLDARARSMMQTYDVRASGPEQPVETLSGGNQQKIVVARALDKAPELVLALNPSRGVDVAATAYIHSQLRAQRERGAAVLLISTELDEVIALSDRIGVLYEGRLLGPVPPSTSRDVLGLMMGGHPPGECASL